MNLTITQTRSLIHASEQQRRTMRALGLRRIRHSVEHADTPMIRGMVAKVHHLVAVERCKEEAPPLHPKKTGQKLGTNNRRVKARRGVRG